jgi:hypothetical protein
MFNTYDLDRLKKLTEIDPQTGCWNWKAAKNNKGYGRLKISGKLYSPHRVMFEMKNGPIPRYIEGRKVCICHSCDNPACCNPAHLEMGDTAKTCATVWQEGAGSTQEQSGSRHYLKSRPLARATESP